YRANHPVELAPSKRVLLSLDVGRLGLGGASCGPRPMAKYMLRPEPVSFAFSLRPLTSEATIQHLALPVTPRVDIRRDSQGQLILGTKDGDIPVRFTLDGSEPTAKSQLYKGPLDFIRGGEVRAVAQAPGRLPGAVSRESFAPQIPTGQMKVVSFDSEQPGEGFARHAIDGDTNTFWHTNYSDKQTRPPHEIQIDMGKTYTLRGLRYTPRQDSDHGRIHKYELYLSQDGKTWGKPIKKGRFPKNRRPQKLAFPAPQTARYIRFVALTEVQGRAWTTIAELTPLPTR
ncbi:MAG: hypothetical protein DRI90_13620, partial [Deltaproteobacteria bacterium]